MVYKHDGYVGRLTSVASYFKLNMDMINIDVQRELFHTGHPVYTKIKDAVPAKYDVFSQREKQYCGERMRH